VFISGVQKIELRRHNEIVAMQAANLVRPKSDCYAAPFGQNRRMMAFVLGEGTHAIGKAERVGKICEPKHSFQPLDTFALNYRPLRNLRLEFLDLSLSNQWRIAPAGGALFTGKCAHNLYTPQYTKPHAQMRRRDRKNHQKGGTTVYASLSLDHSYLRSDSENYF